MRKRVRKYADGGAVLAEPPIPDAPQVTAAPIPDPVIEPDELEQSGLPDSAKAWLRQDKNSKYLYDENASARLADLHFKVVDEGHEAYSPAYWNRLEQRLEQPPARPDVDPEAVDRVLAEARRSAPRPKVQPEPDDSFESSRRLYSAPPSRESRSSNGSRYLPNDVRSIELTPAQKEAARFSNVTESEYKLQLLKLNRLKAEGEYHGGQP